MDLLILIALVAIIGGIGHWMITYFEVKPPLDKILYAILVISLGLYILYKIGFVLPNVLGR